MRAFAVILFLLFTRALSAQEIKCSVQVLYDKVGGIGGSDNKILTIFRKF